MKWSKPLHIIAVLSALLGILSLVAAWVAGINGLLWGLTQDHFFNDAQALLLLSIASGVGTIIHLKLGK